MCPGRSGVIGEPWLDNKLNKDDRCRMVGTGSDDGITGSIFGRAGVEGTDEIGDFVPFLIFLASLRNGEMEREIVLEPLFECEMWPLGGCGEVVRKPLFV